MEGKERLTATDIAKILGVEHPATINEVLTNLKWQTKDTTTTGYIITTLGKNFGGKQQLHKKSGVNYNDWDKSILEKESFLQELQKENLKKYPSNMLNENPKKLNIKPFEDRLASPQLYIGCGEAEKISRHILGAKKTIKIISPYIDEKNISGLNTRFKDHVQVKLITNFNQKEYFSNKEYLELKKNVKFIDTPFIHSKLFIVDSGIAITGSVNFTTKGMKENFETCITINDNENITRLENYFDDLYSQLESK
ncbi:MAG: hypothetical protein Ta2B_05440 [Termitinemataceae bacterium]|nr:MAG: hypothetical protein Ta2B_05440 [Termitinemataceae bacterium]